MNKVLKDLELRSFKFSDINILTEIIVRVWYDNDDVMSEKEYKHAYGLAKLYLTKCLMNSTANQIAIWNGLPVGFITMVDKTYSQGLLNKLRYGWLKELTLVRYHLRTDEQIKEDHFRRINFSSSEGSKKDYQGEVAAMIVDPDFQNLGIGRKLFQTAQIFFKTQKIRTFYLVSDIFSNSNFFEKMRMQPKCVNTTKNIYEDNGLKLYVGRITNLVLEE